MYCKNLTDTRNLLSCRYGDVEPESTASLGGRDICLQIAQAGEEEREDEEKEEEERSHICGR